MNYPLHLRWRRSLIAMLAAVGMLLDATACEPGGNWSGTATNGDDTYDWSLTKRTPSPTPTPSASPTPTVSPTPTPTPTPTIPPPVAKPGVGAATGLSNAGTTDFDILNDSFPAATKMTVERVYETNIPTTWGGRAKTAHDAGRTVYYSTKPNMTAVSQGTLDVAILAWLRLLPTTGAPVYVTFWHEPEDQIRDGQWGTPALTSMTAFKGGTNRLGFLVNVVNAENGNENIRMFLNLMGIWTFESTTYKTYDWNNGFNWPDIDVLCADSYYNLAGNRQTAEAMPVFMAYARSHDKPVSLCEWGTHDVDGQVAKASYIAQTWAWAKAQRNAAGQPDVKHIMYFQFNGGTTNGVPWTFKVHDESQLAYRDIAADARAA